MASNIRSFAEVVARMRAACLRAEQSRCYDLPLGQGSNGLAGQGGLLSALDAQRAFANRLNEGLLIGPVQEVAPAPPKDEDFEIKAYPVPLVPPKTEPRYCPCGAELMGKRAGASICGDCRTTYGDDTVALDQRIDTVALDQRIAEAQPAKVDKDPTEAWGAGQTPGFEWP